MIRSGIYIKISQKNEFNILQLIKLDDEPYPEEKDDSAQGETNESEELNAEANLNESETEDQIDSHENEGETSKQDDDDERGDQTEDDDNKSEDEGLNTFEDSAPFDEEVGKYSKHLFKTLLIN